MYVHDVVRWFRTKTHCRILHSRFLRFSNLVYGCDVVRWFSTISRQSISNSRQVFVDIYGGPCFFQTLETEVREQLANADAKLKTPMPAKGDLDINGVLESRYCFS